VVLVRQRVTLAAGEQVAVDRVRGEEGRDERDRHADPEDGVDEARIHGAGDHGHDEVVDDLHREDRDGVRGQDEPQRCTEGQAAAQQGQAREGVAEEEGQGDRQGDRLPVAETGGGADHEAEDLADRTAGEAVEGGAGRHRHEAAAMALVRGVGGVGGVQRVGAVGRGSVLGVRCGCCVTHGLALSL
jgi:hypothetical protein